MVGRDEALLSAFPSILGRGSVGEDEKAALLRRYWTVPDRQIETSVVLGDARLFGGGG